VPDPVLPARPREVDVLVLGAGQAGLAAGYCLRRTGLAAHTGYVILGAGTGGGWSQMWPSLRDLPLASGSTARP
jgi:cation diffusion facilitator CzcD-associated flavoprotein CzcO